jgi:hypothetical protein
VPDIALFLARIPDESRLEFLADTFNGRADVLTTARDEESQAWMAVYHFMALGVETALLRKRTGIAL